MPDSKSLDADVRSLHAHPIGACPWTVYLYMQGKELQVWPKEKIKVHYGEGVVWTPIDLGTGMVGEFKIKFLDDSPFATGEFDDRNRHSGPVKEDMDKTFTYQIVHASGTYPPLKVVVERVPVGARIQGKKVRVFDEDGQTAVDRSSVPIWSGIDEVVWVAKDGTSSIEIQFDKGCPFDWPKSNKKGQPRVVSGVANANPEQHTYKYTITLGGLRPLDPEVVVDPPPPSDP